MFSFRKRKDFVMEASEKKRAVAFVDFEYWYIALERLHHQKPDPAALRDEISRSFEVSEIWVFGDFSNPSFQDQLPAIRRVTTSVIETQNVSLGGKKNFTDFIMLDHIYRKSMSSRDVDVFLILTGDGHFSSVVSFLTTNLSKEVGVYAVRGSISQQLERAASWVELFPLSSEGFDQCRRCILSNLQRLIKTSEGKQVYPTFRATVDAVSRFYRLDRRAVESTLCQMIQSGEMHQRVIDLPDRTVRVLCLGQEDEEKEIGSPQ